MAGQNFLLFSQIIRKIANSSGNLESNDSDFLEKVMNQLGLRNNANIRLLQQKAVTASSNQNVDVITSPPTVTIAASGGTVPADLTVALGATANAGNFLYTGGTPQAYFSTNYKFLSVTKQGGASNVTGGDGNGWEVNFYTDAPKFTIRIGTSANFRIAVDGQWIQSASYVPLNAAGNICITTVDFAGVRKQRLIRIEGQFGNFFSGINIGSLDRVWQPKPYIRACWIGDSHTTGTGATMANNAYNKIAGWLLGWTDLVQVGIGGTGYINNAGFNVYKDRIAECAERNPNILVISGGQNDTASTTTQIQAAALDCWKSARAAMPNIPIIVVGIIPSSSNITNSLSLAAENALATTHAQWNDNNSVFIPIIGDVQGAWLFGTGKVGATNGSGNTDLYTSSDGTHMSDAGHYYVGQRVAHKIRNWLLGL